MQYFRYNIPRLGGYRTLRHHKLPSVFQQLQVATGHDAQTEIEYFKNQPGNYTDQQRRLRLDIVATHAISHTITGYDVSIANPQVQINIPLLFYIYR